MPKPRTWKRLLPLLLLGLVAVAGAIGLWPPPNEFQFELGVLRDQEPVIVRRTPWRTIVTYSVPGNVEDVRSRVANDLKKTHPHWHALPVPSVPGLVRFLDKKHAKIADVESVEVGPQAGTPGVAVRLISPLRRPSTLQTWTYEVSGWLRGSG